MPVPRKKSRLSYCLPSASYDEKSSNLGGQWSTMR
jgi:hypothetical protein